MVKNPPSNAGDVRDASSIPGSGSSPGGGNGTPLPGLDWETPWTEEPGGLQSIGSQRVRYDRSDLAHTHTREEEPQKNSVPGKISISLEGFL